MSPPEQLLVKKEAAGFRLVRPRQSLFSGGVSIYIPAFEAGLWRTALAKILRRLRQGRYHVVPLTLGLRCMTGSWRRTIKDMRYLGRVERQSFHIVSVAGALYLLSIAGEAFAAPISQDELERIGSQLA